MQKHKLPHVKQTATGNVLHDTGAHIRFSLTTRGEVDGVGGSREVQESGDICIPMVDSCSCMAETNTIL